MASGAAGSQGFQPNRIGVVGAGPVGCVVAAHLAHAGHEVVLCDVVPELLAPAIDPGLRVEGADEVVGRVASTVQSVDEFAADPPELIFVTVKATALPLIANAIESFHRPGVCVVSWQNGIDTEVVLAEHIPSRWVFRAVVNLGVGLPEPGRVHMAFHHPPHWLQGLDEEAVADAEGICALLTAAGLPTRRAEKIVDRVWQKSILNAALNPVCAVTGKTMSQVLHDPFLREMVEGLVKEGVKVARANEINLGWDYYRYGMRYLESAGDHKPSMLVDIENRRRTEVDYINGQIVEFADRAGIEAPYNAMIRALVKAVEPG
jgi:2-dehydropantoate 2-reductase